MKLENNDEFHHYLYELYFKKKIAKINKKYEINYIEPNQKNEIEIKGRYV